MSFACHPIPVKPARPNRVANVVRCAAGLRCGLVILLFAPALGTAGERELWSLWNQHLATPGNHTDLVEACRAYTAAAPQDPLVPVVRSLEAWHLLAAGQTADAVRLLTAQLEPGDNPPAPARAAQRLARAWLTRVQRERVVDALQYYYRKEVRYPAKLEQLAKYPGLPDAANVPWQDASAKPWRYRRAGLADVPAFADQQYILESASIQPPSDLAAALALSYGDQIQVQANRLAGGTTADPIVQLRFVAGPRKGNVAMGQAGSDLGGLTLAHAGPGLVIVCDTLHWKILTWTK